MMQTQSKNLNFKSAAVFGASGSIGDAFCEQLIKHGVTRLYRFSRDINQLPTISFLENKLKIVDIEFDLIDESSISKAVSKLPETLDIVIIATGWLHNMIDNNKTESNKVIEIISPEKSFKELNSEQLYKSWQINFLGPSLLLKTLLMHLNHRKHKTVFGILSARVGSISDNHMGGWHSYRCSKAALNMMIKNLSIELKRARSQSIIVALQPGTTDSNLSKPFQRFLKEGQLQTPSYTATSLLTVLRNLQLENSGTLMDFAGNTIEP